MLQFSRRYPDRFLKHFAVNECGATAIEYAMIASLISVAILTALTGLGTGTDNMFEYVMSKILPALAGDAGK